MCLMFMRHNRKIDRILILLELNLWFEKVIVRIFGERNVHIFLLLLPLEYFETFDFRDNYSYVENNKQNHQLMLRLLTPPFPKVLSRAISVEQGPRLFSWRKLFPISCAFIVLLRGIVFNIISNNISLRSVFIRYSANRTYMF